MKVKSKVFTGVVSLLFCLTILVGCGGQAGSDMNGGDNSTLSESSLTEQASGNVSLNTNTSKDSEPVWAGAQYYQGEAVSLWRKRNGSENIQAAQDIYMYDDKGNSTVVVTGASSAYTGNWFLAQEGFCLTTVENTLIRIESNGTETFSVNVGNGIQDICQLEDGQIVIVVKEADGSFKLALLNPENGEYSKVNTPDLGKDTRVFIASGEDGLLLLKKDGFWEVNLESGELTGVMGISEYDYRLEYTIKDFRMVGGGCVEFLFEGNSEVLLPKDIEEYRTVVTLRDVKPTAWMKALVEEFNRTNFTYYVELETWESGISQMDYLNQLYGELESGEGPDLITEELLLDSQWLMDNSLWFLDNGYLEDLAPYMEKSGICEEDYFPSTFEYLRDGEKIYATRLKIALTGLKIKEDVLGSRVVPDIETFVDALLNYPEAAVLNKYWGAESVLDYLLCGSENLWGAVDWENGTCDFQTDFFARLLEVSTLFASDWNVEMPELTEIIDTSFYNYEDQEQLQMSDEVYIGYFFDDGAHPAVLNNNILVMNSNSKNKEGAWAFINFMLNETTQIQKNLTAEDGTQVARGCPVNVLAFEEVVLLEMEEGAIVRYVVDGEENTFYKAGSDGFVELGRDEEAYRALHDMDEEEVGEIRDMLYTARNLPKKTGHILGIIYEECEMYFANEALLSDTCDAIQSRVQEYLDSMER